MASRLTRKMLMAACRAGVWGAKGVHEGRESAQSSLQLGARFREEGCPSRAGRPKGHAGLEGQRRGCQPASHT